MNPIKILIYLIVIINFTSQIIAQEVEANNINYDAYIASDNVRIRENPSVDSKIIAMLKIGTGIKCLKVTSKKYKVGNNENYWYYCEIPMMVHGWIFGQFITKNKFDFNSYIKNLEKPSNNSKVFISLINKSWSQCKTENEGWGCPYITILDRIIILGADIWGKAYHIKNINIDNNRISIKGDLLFSWHSIDNPNEKLDLSLSINENNLRTIKVNNKNYYLVKNIISWWK